ncbi:hypothetical protein [Streptomyces sp. NRRL S-646]|uniref:hypothetical protein n=1 Tax=Streptomyces sp. NRRL S-646 TaxID=1463917 RepID=UPI0004CB5FCF|nr:hypothetical protein [Streptomyces sp. NRRL S-646]
MKKIVKRGALALIGAAVLAGTQAGAAYANQYDRTAYSYPSGSRVDWKADGEHLLIKDTEKDGHSAVALFRWYDGGEQRFHTYTYFNRDGVDSVRDVNLDLYEGTTVNVKACIGDWAGSLEASADSIRNCTNDWVVTLA